MPIKIHKDYPFYAIDEFGCIFSMPRLIKRNGGSTFKKSGKYLFPSIASNGYKMTYLGRGNMEYVHHLVAELFIGERPDGMTVSHIDGNKLNNHVSNLCYESLADNIKRNSHIESPRGERQGRSRLKEQDVIKIRSLDNYGYGFFSKLGKEYGVSSATIEAAYKRLTWRHI